MSAEQEIQLLATLKQIAEYLKSQRDMLNQMVEALDNIHTCIGDISDKYVGR